MKKNYLLLAVLAIACLEIHADSNPLTFTVPNDPNIVVSSGAHRTPPRVEFPSVSYDADLACLHVDYCSQIDGATYYIRDASGNIVMSGILAFEGNSVFVLDLNSLCAGEYVLEIVNGSYDVIANLSVE